jgi:negative regulator of flagellin synthesis FlgM
MKLNPYQSNVNVSGYKPVSSVAKDKMASQNVSNGGSKTDQVTISSQAKQLNETNRIETERQQRVDELKSQVQSGQYTIQPQKVAEAFSAYWQALGGGGK